MFVAVSGISMPSFWLGLLLIDWFSVRLGWFPTSGYGTLAHFVLPSITLGAGVAAVMARFTRSSFIEIAREDYIRTARAKGVFERLVVWKHVLRNALIPIITSAGSYLPYVFLGSLVFESFFGIPGLGAFVIEAITGQDFAIVRTMVFLGALLYIASNALIDIAYTWVDPRVRLS